MASMAAPMPFTTAADVTELKTFMFDKNHNIAVARDKGGNGVKGNPNNF
jgi:hypothetical protein